MMYILLPLSITIMSGLRLGPVMMSGVENLPGKSTKIFLMNGCNGSPDVRELNCDARCICLSKTNSQRECASLFRRVYSDFNWL